MSVDTLVNMPTEYRSTCRLIRYRHVSADMSTDMSTDTRPILMVDSHLTGALSAHDRYILYLHFLVLAGMLKIIKQNSPIPVFVMIRPRGGDFLYSEAEFKVMQEDIKLFKDAGADGIVFGILTRSA